MRLLKSIHKGCWCILYSLFFLLLGCWLQMWQLELKQPSVMKQCDIRNLVSWHYRTSYKLQSTSSDFHMRNKLISVSHCYFEGFFCHLQSILELSNAFLPYQCILLVTSTRLYALLEYTFWCCTSQYQNT